MALFLSRLGRTSFERRKAVLAVWLLLLIGLGTLAGVAGGRTSTQLTIPGVESIRAGTLLQERLPGSGAGGATARIVFAATSGAQVSDADNRAAIASVIDRAASGERVAGVVDPFQARAVSADGSVAYATVIYAVTANELTDADRASLIGAIEQTASGSLRVEVGGEATQAATEASATELIGVGVALVVLAVTFGSLLAAGLPLITALFGVGTAMGATFALTAVIELSSTAPTLGVMIGLAVGIDYALFIAVRHREILATGVAAREAASRAVGTAGSAVVFAGLTVIIALSGLAVVGIPFLASMGLVAAGVVAVSVVVALTLVPAFLGFAGDRFSRWPIPGLRGRQSRLGTRPSFGTRWAGAVTRRPVAFLLAAVIGTSVLALPALDLELGLPDDGVQPAEATQRKAYDLLADGFGPGFNGPLTLVVDGSGDGLAQAVARLSEQLPALDDVAAVTPATITPAGDTAILNVVPGSGPSTVETKDLVGDIRELRGAIEADTGVEVLVTGNTAVGIDISQKLSDALPVFLGLVVGLSFLLLTVAFRSLLVPLKATVGFLLSVAATFGALVTVFQWGWFADLLGVDATGPILSFLPVLLIGLLFGLAMDYEVFLVSRMREDYVHGASPKEAVIGGFQHGARVVTAAALIMGSVFSGFVLGPDSTIKSIGFALAFGVLVDAFVIRMTFVPAVMALLGHKAWYLPGWLDRLLPDVDIEGAGLRGLSEDHVRASAPAVLSGPVVLSGQG